MGGTCRIYIFGDETFDYSKGLRDLVHQNRDPLVVSFFERTYFALRAEIGHLPQCQQQNLERFGNFPELVAQRLAGSLHPSLDLALACAYQLAHFISTNDWEYAYPKAADSHVIGLCSGALAAAAVCSSTSFSNLLPAAVQSVVVAFRIGLLSSEASLATSPSERFYGNWSMLVPSLTTEDALQVIKAFSETTFLPITSQPYVSASSDAGVTISGPPTTLHSIRNTPSLTHLEFIPLPIKTPYHAPHLFSENDIEFVLSTTLAYQFKTQYTVIPAISSATGQYIWTGEFRSLLHAATEDILRQQFRWEKVSYRLKLIASSVRHIPVIIHQFGSTSGGAVRTVLGKSGCESALVLDQSHFLAQSCSIHSESALSSPINGRPDKSKIAIIGSSGRFPGAEDLSSFWNLLCEGRDVHAVVPPSRWDARTHVDSTGKRKNTSATPFGCWLDRPELFDSKFFNISPREAPQVDPAQRIALLTAYEAIERAGIVPGASPSTQKDRVGVFYGVTSNDWMETNSAQDIDTYMIPGGNRAFIPGRINYFFNFSGPSYSVDTACSSSLASIHVACNALWRGEIDTAVAGGTNVLTNPDFTAGLDRGHFLSRTGNCKTFDETADGYCRGEGIATVILKRLEDAIYDRDPIEGVISGACTNHSAEAESITRPHVAAQKDIFRKIISSAAIDPYDVGYVEMHGTGTKAGDGAEIRSVVETFAPDDTHCKRSDKQDLYIGSVKSNIGHGEAASGVTSLVKILLMMKRGMIPPHCGIKTKINQTFPTNLHERRVFIADQPTPWTRPEGGHRRAFINNFSAAGGNTALLLEDAPIEKFNERPDCRSTFVVAVSAKCAASLQGNITALVSFLENSPATELSQLSWTTTARRIHHQYRIMVHGNNIQMINANLRRALENNEGVKRPPSRPKITFVFTGQGSAYLGMAKSLYEGFSSFRCNIDRFETIATKLGFPAFKLFLIGVWKDNSEPTSLVSQLATVCLEMALARLWKSIGIVPHSTVGHSLGEYAALNVAGVISDSDTIYLVGKRAQLLQELCLPDTQSMLAIRGNPGIIKKILVGKKYEAACINSSENLVISSTNDEIQDAQKLLVAQNIKATILCIPYAFHSAQVEPILSPFEKAAQAVSFQPPKIPVLNPLDATVVHNQNVFGPNHLSRHCREPVNFLGAIDAAKKTGLITDKATFLELGPHPVVSAMVKAILPQAHALPSLKRSMDMWQVLAQTISTLYSAGTDLHWRELHRDYESSQKVLQLPGYRWDLKEYWMQYVNDWSLRKGDPPSTQHVTPPEMGRDETTTAHLESTTIHKVVEEVIGPEQGRLTLESDISRPDLNPLVQGHKVNGIPLCTPSVYADIALSVGEYLRQHYWSHLKSCSTKVVEMVIEKALIAASSGSQLLQTTAELDGTKSCAKLAFSTLDLDGHVKAQHAKCEIRFGEPGEVQGLQQKVPEMRAQICEIRKRLETKRAYLFNKPMIYKMVATLAEFDPDYRGLDEIVLDSSAMEASSIANFSGMKRDGKFFTNPAYIDALSQSAGFVMNANDKSNLELEVFVNHGWKSFQLFEKLSAHTEYETHVAMSESPGKMWKGDIYVLDEGKLVAVFEGIALQGVARRLLHHILSTESATQTGSKRAQESLVPAKVTHGHAPKRIYKEKASSRPKPPSSSSSKSANSETLNVPRAKSSELKRIPSAVMQQKVISETQSIPLWEKALQIVLEESGIACEELGDDTVLADVGIDSLLGLMIASRFRDELSVDVDAATLHGLSTIKGLKIFLSGTLDNSIEDTTVEVGSTKASSIVAGYQEPTQPQHVSYISSSQENELSIGALSDYPHGVTEAGSSTEGCFARVLRIISDESGIDIGELTDDTNFSDAGIDSLLSLMISSRLRDELDLGTSADVNLFNGCSTLRDLRFHLAPANKPKAKELLEMSSPIGKSYIQPTRRSSITESIATDTEDEVSENKTDTPVTSSSSFSQENIPEMLKSSFPARRATSVILQGRPWICSRTLFLFPDGAGSASSYANLPRIHSDLAVLALNCPYVRHPQEMTCSLDELMKSYLEEVKRRQPNGPYNLGGWSAGGILAYRATQILIEEGQEVESLVLIDSPVPKGLDRLPQRFYDHLSSINIFGNAMPGPTRSPPAQLFAHFNATIEVLHRYHAKPLPSSRLKKGAVIWATDSVVDGVKLPTLESGPDDTEGMKFLTEKRTDFTGAGWEALLPGTRVDVERVEGAHHFSMMQHLPQAQQLCEHLCKIIVS